MSLLENEPVGRALSAQEFADAVSRAAHDLNNLCASMLGFAALTQESLEPDSPLQAYVVEIQASAEKTAALAEHLRRLARTR